MPDIHASVGFLTLTGEVLMGYADSDDGGEQTDVSAAVADVQIEASVPRIVVVANKAVVNLPIIKGSLNAEGQLVAPADGKSTTGTSTTLRLIAPDQSSVHPVAWYWTVTVRPIAGSGVIFEPFSVIVDGAPEEALSIGGQLLAGRTPTVTVYPSYVEIEDVLVLNEETGNYIVNVPEGTPVGSLLAGVNEDGAAVVLIYK